MVRHKSTESKQQESKRQESERREPEQRNTRGTDPELGKARNVEAADDGRGGAEAEQPDWADEAAQARTASDPRRVTPHDRAGVPSTGRR
jgi:hypothetical protein